MWPMYVDYSDEECKQKLRHLELTTYREVISTMRALGGLTNNRKRILQDLSNEFSIPAERHRAEIRRAINDEHLNTIAERLFGPNTTTEWAMEGRRVVPLMQRLTPVSCFTEIADITAAAATAKNSTLPIPSKTGVREMPNGVETVINRKRKHYTPEDAATPVKVPIFDAEYFHSLLPPDNLGSSAMDTSQASETSKNSDNCVPDPVSQAPTSFSEATAQKNISFSSPAGTNPVPSVATPKSTVKPLHKSPTNVPPFGSMDQMSSNAPTNRITSQVTPPVINLEDSSPEAPKSSNDAKSGPRQLSSLASMKSSTVVIPTPPGSTVSVTSSKERLTPPSSGSSPSNKFLQLRSKATPNHPRQSLPAGLGIKLATQSAMNQRATAPVPKPMKMKHESIFNKKVNPPSGFSSLSDSNQVSQFPASLQSSDSLTITKSTLSVPKPPSTKLDSNPSTLSNTPPIISKQQSVAKALPKTTTGSMTPTTSTQNSGYISRPPMFSGSSKAAKTMPPVIFNVASTSGGTIMTTTKTTSLASSEAGKATPTILPKSTTVGISSSHLKINTSNTQTIQYRNDGGLVRSARIVNISQPVGSRLPCSISPSAISALGLSNPLTSTALRVTLPAGSLSSNSSLRVSAAAKPNVIVVHKAQMWPRAPQGAAVIMSSSPLSKMSNDMVQETIITTKHDKKPPPGSKPTPRAIAPARPQSPAVSVTSVRISESTLMQNPSVSQPDSTTPDIQIIQQETPNEAQCKKNLLADVIEESGLMDSNGKAVAKETGNGTKNAKELANLTHHQELEVTLATKQDKPSSNESSTSKQSSEPQTSKGGEPELSVTQIDKSKKEAPKQKLTLSTEKPAKETSSSTTTESVSNIESETTTAPSDSATAQKETEKPKEP